MGFVRGPISDKISLYADDTLLYLGDVEASLTNVMKIIQHFGSLSGFSINWSKSIILPVDEPMVDLPVSARPLKVVSSFKYLGIHVSVNPKKYLEDNLLPLFKKLQMTCTTWCKLPLSVIGRINLIKMVWGPQLLYIMHNSPQWIPRKWFNRIETLFRSLIWRKKVARISLSTLQYGKDRGGAAVPNPKLYFYASQLQHLSGLGLLNDFDSVENMLRTGTLNTSVLAILEAGLLHLPQTAPTIVLLKKLWSTVKSKLQVLGFLAETPLWNNPNLAEVYKLEGFQLWRNAGIHNISQLFHQNILKSFMELQSKFGLPRHQFYRYLQLRHALQTQSRSAALALVTHPLINDIFYGQEKKGLISHIYSHLLSAIQDTANLPCRRRWIEDLGEVSEDIWDTCLQTGPLTSVSQTHRLSHLFLIHRAYRTPIQLHRWGRRDSPLCPKRCGEEGSLIHLMWRCPKLHCYWGDVTDTISSVFQIRVPLDPLICILGAIDEEIYPPPNNIAIIRLLYLARKLVARFWLSVNVPTKKQWIEQVNYILIREHLTYQHRNASRKFNSIWQPWLNSPGLAPPQLIMHRIFQV